MTFWRSRPKSSDASCDSRARIQLTLPISVLISPLWPITRYGWASSQVGNVFVEKRRVDQRHAGAEALVLEVRVEVAELVADQHPLVDARARGEARASRSPGRRPARRSGGSRRACARRRPGRRRSPSPAPTNSCLMYGRVRLAVSPTCSSSIGTSRQPRTLLALDADVELEQLLELAPRGPRRAGGSTRRRRSGPAAGSSKSDDLAEERVGNLDEDAGAVAGLGVRALRSAVLEVVQRGQRAFDDLVARARCPAARPWRRHTRRARSGGRTGRRPGRLQVVVHGSAPGGGGAVAPEAERGIVKARMDTG